jgi:hypothetical protein
MLTPSIGYEAGKGRELELERQLARRRLLAEARDAQRSQQPQHPSLLDRIVERLKAIGRRRDERSPDLEIGGFQRQRPAAV